MLNIPNITLLYYYKRILKCFLPISALIFWRWGTILVTLLEVGLQKLLWASKSSYHFTGRQILIQ